MKKFLIIPDVHGRDFWKGAVENCNLDEFEKVIFLGDYLDPYAFENTITTDSALENFKAIVEFKKSHSDKVVLLLGNHDLYYFFKCVGPSRYCYRLRREIESVFEENREFFSVAFESENTLFTHAGLVPEWIEQCRRYYNIEATAESLNSLLSDGMECLAMVSGARGGRYHWASPLWTDVSEMYDYLDEIEDGKIKPYGKKQVFGHTLQIDTRDYYKSMDIRDIKDGTEIIEDNFAMLDCRHAFIYDEEDFSFVKID